MLVRDLMSDDVVSVDHRATVDEAVGRMLAADVGSVVVTEEGRPVGILTEQDILRAVHEADAPLSTLAVADLSHRPVMTTSPDSTVPWLARRMAEEGVKKVPVMDGLELVGIVTLTDVVWHLAELRQEASNIDARRSDWES
jgi:CBS domain-containing protein